MEKHIDQDISEAERASLRQQNTALLRQNELLKQEVAQLKARECNLQKELTLYKKTLFSSNGDTHNEVLELQHQRIFDLETQLEILQSKYGKLMRSGGSNEQTEYAIRCKDYERRLREGELGHQKQLAVLREKLMKQNAQEFVEAKRTITSPNAELKKSSLAVRKLV
jgi:hypothetical protein